jgi:hypothetical protein
MRTILDELAIAQLQHILESHEYTLLFEAGMWTLKPAGSDVVHYRNLKLDEFVKFVYRRIKDGESPCDAEEATGVQESAEGVQGS